MKYISKVLLFFILFFPGTISAQIPEITRVGQWGTGLYKDVAIQGKYAYCAADGKGLEIINISNPSSPGKVGELEFDISDGGLKVKGNYVYVATGLDGFKVIDVSVPSSPKLAGILDIWACDLEVRGDYAYVINYHNLIVVDISIPSKPGVIGLYSNNSSTDLCLIDNYVYLISYYSFPGVDIIDISNPSFPVQVNSTKLSGVYYHHIFYNDQFAYLSHTKGVSILDVSNPIVPTQVGELETETSIGALYAVNNYLYAADIYYNWGQGDKAFHIFDVSDPSSPVLSGTGMPSEKVFNMEVCGNYLYAAVGQGGLEIFNVSNVSKPVELGNYDLSGEILDMEVRGNYAYLAGESAMLKILNISNPSSPRQISTYGDRTGSARQVQVIDHYAYLFSPYGFLIIDISKPSSPKELGRYPLSDESGLAFYVSNNHAYMVVKIDNGAELQIFDLTDPTNPKKKGTYTYSQRWSYHEVCVIGNYLYWCFYSYYNQNNGILLDVSDPNKPTLVKNIDIGSIRDFDGTGKYAYTCYQSKLNVVDVSDPSSPVVVGEYDHYPFISTLQANGNYVFMFDIFHRGMTVVDVSNPGAPTGLGTYYQFPNGDLYIKDNYLYVGIFGELFIYSINDPNPFTSTLTVKSLNYTNADISVTPADRQGNSDGFTNFIRTYDQGTLVTLTAPEFNRRRSFSKWTLDEVDVTANRAVQINMDQNHTAIAHYEGSLYSHKLLVYALPVITGVYVDLTPEDIEGKGGGSTTLIRYYEHDTNVTLTAPPMLNGGDFIKWVVDTHEYKSLSVEITMNAQHTAKVYYEEVMPVYALAVQSFPVTGVNIAVAPVDKYGKSNGATNFNRIFQEGTEVTLTAPGTHNGKTFSKWTVDGTDITSNQALQITMDSTHMAIAHYEPVINVCTLTIQSSPGDGVEINAGPGDIDGNSSGTTNFTMTYNQETRVTLIAPETYNDQAFCKWTIDGVDATNNLHLQITIDSHHTITAHYAEAALPSLALNRSRYNFGAAMTGMQTDAQSLLIHNSGGGLLNWKTSTSEGWLLATPSDGTNDSEVFISVDPTGLSPGTYTGTITISAPDALHSPETVQVTLKVYQDTVSPLGVFSTPINGAVVKSSIPVTGWALDDIGVKSVKIYRDRLKSEGGGKQKVYIGDAVLVDGARPDVEAAYPGYPMNYKAGWGYMMLTNFLPGGGNGTFNIHAIVTDIEGNQVNLDTKTITCDNANAVKPFGAIDTPTQGGTASGKDFVDFGWALTPLPNTIPKDGSTITVWVDGKALGKPVYNRYREDIAALFPGYNNSEGAVGYFYLDTTPYNNGVHTIQWTVTDDAGNTDGIGSRYFSIRNASQQAINNSNQMIPDISLIPVDNFLPIYVKKGYKQDMEPQMVYPDERGNITIEIRQLERVEFYFFVEAVGVASISKGSKTVTHDLSGSGVVGNLFPTLPVGSALDIETGVFTWQPGIGYLGEFPLVFLLRDETGHLTRKMVIVKIVPGIEKK